MILIQLFLSFVKIGFTSFGGISMIPLIFEEMQKHNWMTAEDLTNLIAIAEMTPGPLGINCATFAGMRAAGVIGGIAAVIGVLMPAFTLTLIVAVCFTKFRENKLLDCLLTVVKPICIGMVLVTILKLGVENYFPHMELDLIGCGIGLVVLFMLIKRNWTVPKVIGLSAVLGIIGYGVLPML